MMSKAYYRAWHTIDARFITKQNQYPTNVQSTGKHDCSWIANNYTMGCGYPLNTTQYKGMNQAIEKGKK